MEPSSDPVRIQLDRPARRLRIDWADGVCCGYPWDLLRANCPSAGERTAREGPQANPLAVLSHIPSTDLVDLRMAGNYALIFTWGDGHNAGIYTWEYLRSLAEHEAVEKTALV